MWKIVASIAGLLVLAAGIYLITGDSAPGEPAPPASSSLDALRVDEQPSPAATPAPGDVAPAGPGQVRTEVERTALEIAGTVVDRGTGEPLSGVPLHLEGKEGAADRTATSGDGGRFHFDELERATYELRPAPAGDLDYRAEPLSIAVTEEAPAIEFAVERAWFLAGVVLRKGSGLPAAGVRMAARQEEQDASTVVGTSAADGSFRSREAYTAGKLTVFLSGSQSEGLLRSSQPAPALARLEVGTQPVNALRLELPWDGVLHGVVRDDLSRPVAGAEVRVLSADSTYLRSPALRFWTNERRAGDGVRTRTDRDGRFDFTLLPNDRLLAVVVRAAGFALHRSPDLEPPFLASDPAVELQLISGGSIVGRLETVAGEPREGAMVAARWDDPDGYQPDPAWTDAGGAFRLDHLAPGTYQVSAEVGNGLERRAVASGQAEVRPGEETELLLKEGQGGARFSGVAVDQNGLIITADRAQLVLRCALNGARLGEEPWRPDPAINADGTFEITVNHPGREYRLTLLGDAAGETWETQVVEAPAQDLRLVYRIAPVHTVIVRALDAATCERLDQGDVSLRWEQGSIGANFLKGELPFQVREGRYSLTVDVADYSPATRELEIRANQEENQVVEMRLARGRRVEGKVVGTDGRPAKGHAVMLLTEEGGLQTRSLVYSGDDGRFTLAAAPLTGGSACVVDENYRILTTAPLGPGEVVLVLK